MTKVFGIGFQKTGTTTLGSMLERLGLRVGGYYDFRDMARQDGLDMAQVEARALSLAQKYDAAKDTPWPLLYRQLDAAFPGSKFVHVIRNPDAWIRSAVNDFGDHPNAIHNVIYGTAYPKGNEAAWLARYHNHNVEVAAYFENRPDDYLQIQLEDGITFAKLCPFLGKPLIEETPPKANTQFRKRIKMAWWRLTGQR